MRTTVTRTYLELVDRRDLVRESIPSPDGAVVTGCSPVSANRFRELYTAVGAAHHWHDRDPWTDEEIEERFAGERVSLWELTISGVLAGFYELERHDDGAVEIVLFGLLSDFSGRGIGKWLLVDAVDRAWSLGATRVWLHTCTLDAPAALPNYMARGFRPYRSEQYEIDR